VDTCLGAPPTHSNEMPPKLRMPTRTRSEEDFEQDARSLLGSLWCGILGIVLIWLLVITLVYGFLLWGTHDSIRQIECDVEDLKDKVEENDACCDDINNTLNMFQVCLDGLCDPDNFPRLLGAVICKGCWDAAANDPPLSSGLGTNGDLYHVCTPGATEIDGNSLWDVGDTLKFIVNTPTGARWIRNGGGTSVLQTWTPTYSSNDNDLNNLPNHRIAFFQLVDDRRWVQKIEDGRPAGGIGKLDILNVGESAGSSPSSSHSKSSALTSMSTSPSSTS